MRKCKSLPLYVISLTRCTRETTPTHTHAHTPYVRSYARGRAGQPGMRLRIELNNT